MYAMLKKTGVHQQAKLAEFYVTPEEADALESGRHPDLSRFCTCEAPPREIDATPIQFQCVVARMERSRPTLTDAQIRAQCAKVPCGALGAAGARLRSFSVDHMVPLGVFVDQNNAIGVGQLMNLRFEGQKIPFIMVSTLVRVHG